MEQQFFHIASIRFQHEYNGNERFEGFSVSAAGDSGKRLGNLSVIIKPFAGGIHILSSDPALLRGEREPVLLRMAAKDPLFSNFTDLGTEFRPGAKVFCFSNHGENHPSGRLHPGEFVSMSDSLDVLDQRALREILPELVSDKISLHESGGEAIVPADFSRYFTEIGESVLYIKDGSDLRGFYKGDQGMNKTPFGVISLDLDAFYTAYLNLETPIDFQIRFRSRKTFWKYILSDKVFDKFTSLSVIDAQNKTVLFREGEFEIQSAWKVRSFESEVELPFSADFNPRFQLIERSEDENQAGKVVLKQLPKASPAQLYHLPTDNEILYAHIFI